MLLGKKRGRIKGSLRVLCSSESRTHRSWFVLVSGGSELPNRRIKALSAIDRRDRILLSVSPPNGVGSRLLSDTVSMVRFTHTEQRSLKILYETDGARLPLVSQPSSLRSPNSL